jgi:hypothetical protein
VVGGEAEVDEDRAEVAAGAGNEVGLVDFKVDFKVILPNTQSIDGL